MLTAIGSALPTSEHHSAGAFGLSPQTLRLSHGGAVYFAVHYPAQTGYGSLRCPTSAALLLTAPGTPPGLVLRGTGAAIRAYGGTTVHLHCGMLSVSPLSAKRFQ